MKRKHARQSDAVLAKWVRQHARQTEPPCPIWKQECACPLMPLPAEEQNAFKRNAVVQAFSSLPIEIAPIVAAQTREHYRSKIVFAYDGYFGGYARGTHKLLDLDGCVIEAPLLARVAEWLRENVRVKSYAEGGELRYVVMREGCDVNAQERALVAFIGAPLPAWAKATAEALRRDVPEVAGVSWSENTSSGNAVWVAPAVTICGAETISEDLGPFAIELGVSSFFQVHRTQAAKLREALLAATRGTRVAWDLFCGAGVNAFLLAHRGAEAFGVESFAPAIADAEKNATRLGLAAKFLCASLDGKTPLDALPSPDAVVLNPPRKGASSALIDAVILRAPKKIVYIACAPEPLAHAATRMYEKGYIAESVTPFDLFPHTPHVETLAVFVRA